MEELTINKAHLMGLSVGCAVALTFAANFPDQVQSLILEGPVGGILPPTHPKAWFKVLFHMVFPLLLFLSIILLGHHRTATLINRLGVQSSKRYLLLESIQKEADFKAIRQIIFEIAYPPYVGKLKQIQAPTFIAVGQEDIVPERYYRYIMENIQGPSELMLFSNARHIVALEKPDEYNAAVLNFLKPFLEPFPENASNKLVG
jgi:pimeloyl-ACP methyl ester carboxylesterase